VHQTRKEHPARILLGLALMAASLVMVLFPLDAYYLVWKGRMPETQRYYTVYYQHFYKAYVARDLTPYEADYYADYYADFYARYYTSKDYKAWAENSLPTYSQQNASYPAASAIADLKTTPKGVELIKYFEGYQEKPYLDAAGKMTIGYGHMIKPSEFYTALGKEDAERLLRQDIELAEAAIKREVKVDLTPNQFSALVSLVYNIGPTQFRNSTLLKKINGRDFAGSGQEIVRWTKVNGRELDGLVSRRYSEYVLFGRES
jgi:lysozyme